jgi:hypothetical protein
MEHWKMWIATCVLIVSATTGSAAAFAQQGQKGKTERQAITQPSDQDLNIRAYIELLRSDVRSQATEVVGEIMRLEGEESKRFWPIYREFELELGRQGDRKFELIKKYSDNYGSLSDEVADELVRGIFALEQERHNLKMRYYDRMKQALSARIAARFLQVSNQILMLIDLQIAASLPAIP